MQSAVQFLELRWRLEARCSYLYARALIGVIEEQRSSSRDMGSLVKRLRM